MRSALPISLNDLGQISKMPDYANAIDVTSDVTTTFPTYAVPFSGFCALNVGAEVVNGLRAANVYIGNVAVAYAARSGSDWEDRGFSIIPVSKGDILEFRGSISYYSVVMIPFK